MNAANTPGRSALVVGGTGISGSALCRELVAQGWQTTSLSRGETGSQDGIETVHADLTDRQSVQPALAGLNPTHVFFTAWSARTPKRRTSGSTQAWSATCWTPGP